MGQRLPLSQAKFSDADFGSSEMSEAVVHVRKRTGFTYEWWDFSTNKRDEGQNLRDCGEEAAEKSPCSLYIWFFKKFWLWKLEKFCQRLFDARDFYWKRQLLTSRGVFCFSTAGQSPSISLPFLSSTLFLFPAEASHNGTLKTQVTSAAKRAAVSALRKAREKGLPCVLSSRFTKRKSELSLFGVSGDTLSGWWFLFFFFPFWKKLFPCCGRVPGSQRRLWLDGHFINYKPPESESLCRMGPAIWSSTLYTIKAIVSALWLGYFKEPSATVEGNRCIFIPNSLGLFNPTMSRHLERLLLWFPFKRWGNWEIEELSVLFTKGF